MKTLLAVLALVTLGFGTVALTAPANASKTFLFRSTRTKVRTTEAGIALKGQPGSVERSHQ